MRVSLLHQCLRSLHRDRRGVATVEFTLAFPVLLFLVLVLLQTAMVMVGRAYVHYAAFAATRAAISQVPADLSGQGGEGPNAIVISNASPKLQAIQRAAAVAIAPVSGRNEDDHPLFAADAARDALSGYLADAGIAEGNWVDRSYAQRLRYAAHHTRVWLQVLPPGFDEESTAFVSIPDGAEYTFGPLETVTVRVEHDLAISVPYVWRIFADGDRDDAAGGFATLTSRATLHNEGIDPRLPEEPPLPRVDP